MASEELVPLRDKPLRQLNRIAKRPKLDLEFLDLRYSVRDNKVKGGRRQILKSVNGKFRCGEFTAIMGPSGAGKTTLLNILAGYVSSGVEGIVNVNDQPRDMRIFNKLSSYIMQEDIVQPHLTVQEAMIFAARLKLGAHITYKDKLAVVDEVIHLLGLEKCIDTLSQYLSGGQKKRLRVALELVNNPPVIFLDEPTTGLDNYSISQCIRLLKKITQLDRTVICTIHQPPASIFQFFDQVYVVADGYCVYNGSPTQLVPYFSLVGYSCPPNNTPADYIIELLHSQPTMVQSFRQTIQDGKLNLKAESPRFSKGLEPEGVYSDTTEVIDKSDTAFANSFWVQFRVLLSRMILQMKRNRIGFYLLFFHHLLSGVFIGGTFYGTGNDATQTIAIFKYCVCCNMFFVYTQVMLPILLFPLEVDLMKREYFNRWYGLKAFYSAMTLATLPMLMILSAMFTSTVYFLTGQPFDWDRLIGFTLMGQVMAITSQGLGHFLGSMCTIMQGCIIGPAVMTPMFALSVYGMGYRKTIEPFYKFMMTLTFIRNGVVGTCDSIFYEREPLECPPSELYCHYSRPDVLMEDMALPMMHYTYQAGIICIFLVLFRVCSYLSLKCGLSQDFASRIVYSAMKVLKHRF